MGTPHDLRRTYATEMASHVDLITLTRWLGHADPKTTQEFYHRVRPETEQAARAALDALHGPVRAETDAQVTRNGDPGEIGAADGNGNRVPDTMTAQCARSSIG
ncbi:MAG: tyrosine-type recombinase/integrase [Planctomycetes bacterium]|nr:tyrosine-type recombinase/integrase [Planctomycetota bacterium]